MQLTQNALDAVKGDDELTKFVEEIRINVLYAKMYENSWDFLEKEKAFEEFKTLVAKHGIERPYEVAPPDMNEFVNDTYPMQLTLIKLYVSLCVIGGIALVAAGITVSVIVIKRRKKKS